MQTEFTIKSLEGYTFRPKVMRAVEINAIMTTTNLEDINSMIKTYDYCLEHLEVNLKGVWTQVKKGNDYWPANLENDAFAVKELVEWFLENVVFKAFQKSSE